MSRSYLSQPRMPGLPAGTALDAISTSSSTLVNPDLDEDTIRRRQYRSTHAQALSHDRSNVYNGMKPGTSTSQGWLKGEVASPSSSYNRSQLPRKEYPDDHRCSDQETASGLCGCNRDAESGSSSSPATASEEETQKARVDSSYDQQLLAARKRKLMMEKRSQSPDTITVMRAEIQDGMRASTSQLYSDRTGNHSRDLHSDPVLVPRPASSRSYDENLRSADVWHKESISTRPWASSPIKAAFEERERSRTPQHSANPIKAERSQSSTPAPPSAARKSISSVFEKLLKEEEQRREEERAKKEAARERRRESKRRKEEEWPQISVAKTETSSETLQAPSRDAGLGVEHGSDESNMPETSTQLQQDATRLERLARKSPLSSSIARIAPRPSPEKPAASSYKAKLAALRSASVEEKIAPFPSYRLADPLPSSPRHPRVKSVGSNHSSSDDSHALEGDPVSMGSEFQGQAPLQSTPPRNSPSTRSKILIESPTTRLKTLDSSLVEDSLRQTVEQLTSVLHEVRDIKGDASAIEQLPIVELKRATDQRELALQSVSNEERKKITDIDRVYVQRLGQIRERLQGAKSKKPSSESIEIQPRSSRTRSFLVTLFIQILFACLMMKAAEIRARQLFLTTYYDPFLPHDFMDLSQAYTGNLFGPFFQKWSPIPAHHYPFEDDIPYTSQTWTTSISLAAHDLLRGPDRTRAVKLISTKVSNMLGLNTNNSFYTGSSMPT